jgi:hypothetical protein
MPPRSEQFQGSSGPVSGNKFAAIYHGYTTIIELKNLAVMLCWREVKYRQDGLVSIYELKRYLEK